MNLNVVDLTEDIAYIINRLAHSDDRRQRNATHFGIHLEMDANEEKYLNVRVCIADSDDAAVSCLRAAPVKSHLVYSLDRHHNATLLYSEQPGFSGMGNSSEPATPSPLAPGMGKSSPLVTGEYFTPKLPLGMFTS